MIKFLTFLSLCALATLASAQSAVYPSPGTLYDESLHKVELLMHPDSVLDLFDDRNSWTNHSYRATFVYDDTDTLFNVGVRIKGNTSRNAHKKSIKIETDEFVNQSYQGLKTFNFNGSHNDPSVTREFLSCKTMNLVGCAAQRSTPVKLYFNGVYKGIYNHAEQVDRNFVRARFGNSGGNLYKCSWPADLAWLGPNQAAYKALINPSPLNERAYELKTNTSADDYTDLVNFINVINNTPAANFRTAIESVFDVQSYLKTLAVEVLLGHWDNYFYNKNNYYLYKNTATGKFQYIPYDMDNTFGVEWGVPNINVRNIHQWGNANNTTAPLTNKILAVQDFKRDYENYIYQIIQSVYNETYMFPRIDTFENVRAPAMLNEPYYTGLVNSDYGFDLNDWRNSYNQRVTGPARFGIKPFIAARKSSALTQFLFPVLSIAPVDDFCVKIFPNPTSQYLNIVAKEDLGIQVVNLLGEVVSNETLSAGESTLDVQGWGKGVFVLKIQSRNKVLSQKVVVH